MGAVGRAGARSARLRLPPAPGRLREPPGPPATRGPRRPPEASRGGLPPPARASRAHTCRTRCRASTKPSAFMPTGALCPCTSSAMANPTATAVARLPRSGLPLRSGTRSRKGKVAPLPAEGKRREGTARSEREREIGWGKAASVRRGLKTRDRCPAEVGAWPWLEGVCPGHRQLSVKKASLRPHPPKAWALGLQQRWDRPWGAGVAVYSPCCLFLQPDRRETWMWLFHHLTHAV